MSSGIALGRALSLQLSRFCRSQHPSLEGPELPRKASNLSPKPSPTEPGLVAAADDKRAQPPGFGGRRLRWKACRSLRSSTGPVRRRRSFRSSTATVKRVTISGALRHWRFRSGRRASATRPSQSSLPGALVPEKTSLRTVPAAFFDDGQRLEIQSVTSTVIIFGRTRDEALTIAGALRGVNMPVQASDSLPQPAVGALDGTLRCG
jgi:hypothetical protein